MTDDRPGREWSLIGVSAATRFASGSLMGTALAVYVGDVAPADRESELMRLRSTAKTVGGVAGPPLLGVVATITSYEAAFTGRSLLAFGAAVLAAVALVESKPAAAGVAAAGD